MKKALSLLLALTLVLTLFAGIGTVSASNNPDGDYIVAERKRPYLVGNGDAVGNAVGSIATISDKGWRTGTTQAHWVVGESAEPNTDECLTMHLTSSVAEGQGPNNASPLASIVPYMDINPAVGVFMLYIESPTLAPNTNWALRFDTFYATQSGINAWGRFYGMKYKYLARDGKDWLEGRTDANETIILPNGFKGYVKFYLNDCYSDNANTVTLYDYFAGKGYDMTKNFTINSMDFVFGSLGGEYGDFVVGGMYNVSRDSDNVYGCLYDWYNSDSSTPNRMTTYQPSLRVKQTSAVLLPGGSYAVGDTVTSSNVASISDKGWRTGKTQATIKVGPAAEPSTDNYSVVLHSDVAEGQGPNNGSPAYSFRTNVTIDPNTNAMMVYMETPTRDESSNISYILRLNTCWCTVNGTNKWGHLYSMKIAYLANDADAWVEGSTSAGEDLVLPSGFKGYVKFYLNTAMQESNKTFYEHIGYTDPSTQTLVMNSFDLVFGWLGGEYGDLVMGGVYSVTEDGNTTYAEISDKNGLNATKYDLVKCQHPNTKTPVRKNIVEPTVDTDGSYDLVTYCADCEEVVSSQHITYTYNDMKQDVLAPYLKVAAQLKAGDDSCKVRLISMLDNDLENYGKVGFAVTIGEETVDYDVNTVYTSYLGENDEKVTAASYGADYFTLVPITVGAGQYGNEITVVPYVDMADGTRIEGAALSFILNEYL